jgi:hypothetical protein
MPTKFCEFGHISQKLGRPGLDDGRTKQASGQNLEYVCRGSDFWSFSSFRLIISDNLIFEGTHLQNRKYLFPFIFRNSVRRGFRSDTQVERHYRATSACRIVRSFDIVSRIYAKYEFSWSYFGFLHCAADDSSNVSKEPTAPKTSQQSPSPRRKIPKAHKLINNRRANMTADKV